MLVAPVNKIEKLEERILEFKGLNKKPMIEDGEMSDMQNLCSEMYPCLYPRRKRTRENIVDFVYYNGITYDKTGQQVPDIITSPFQKVHDVIVKRDYSHNKTDEIAALVYGWENVLSQQKITEVCFYYRGNRYQVVEEYLKDLSNEELEKQYLVAINSNICIFPSGVFFNTSTENYDVDMLDETSICGTLYYKHTFTDNAAFHLDREDRNEGYISLELKNWDTEPDASPFKDLKTGDIVKFVGTLTFASGGVKTYDNTNPAYPYIVGREVYTTQNKEYIRLQLAAFDIPDTTEYQGAGTISSVYLDGQGRNATLTKDLPELNFVMEHDNRLWGVSNKSNTIYASKLGDPSSWEYYQQTSMDSYYAEQGSNGDWTGVSVYNNHMLFFKEECIVKVYGTSPSTYQTQVIYAPGVEKSSPRSLAILDSGMVIYNSPDGIMAYEGDYPYSISKKLTNDKLVNVVGGGHFNKYYAYIDEDNSDNLKRGVYVLDVDNAVWHLQDDFAIKKVFVYNSKTYAIGTEINGIHSSSIKEQVHLIDASKDRSDIEWYAVLGPFTEYLEDHKVYSKMDMRIKKSEDATLKFYIKVDEGEWEECNLGVSSTNLCYHQTIVPRRCHEFSIKIVGKGDVRIDSLRRRFRKGTEGDL